mmetsp:Transcript_26647/g.50631  ORF Transcript_26647/g.50631 Transcript_26647/m.50631 type:complete len:170 (+) Transcript_26647:189-698(+)|eukprot:CAMPEP_0114226140 /NCGR_PEP_ID=MMETSP0058-20121206/1073_1 /TAXON_ID=36894 /ORGANISM="Pyramimonas parkeae, CCMP726" /LENGTH=169 /DNA_ID=CAMNT_0001336845 /DNA_START=100 /DNA_END=609 /DNA_ORIENTATION=-
MEGAAIVVSMAVAVAAIGTGVYLSGESAASMYGRAISLADQLPGGIIGYISHLVHRVGLIKLFFQFLIICSIVALFISLVVQPIIDAIRRKKRLRSIKFRSGIDRTQERARHQQQVLTQKKIEDAVAKDAERRKHTLKHLEQKMRTQNGQGHVFVGRSHRLGGAISVND